MSSPEELDRVRKKLDSLSDEQLRTLFAKRDGGSGGGGGVSSGGASAILPGRARGRVGSSSSGNGGIDSNRGIYTTGKTGEEAASNRRDGAGGREKEDRDKAPQRPLTLDELLSCPLSNIFEVRLGQADVLRTAGNDAFKKGQVDIAVQLYQRALRHCSMDEDRMSADTHRLRQAMYVARDPIHLNLARCFHKLERHRECVASARSVVRADGEDGPAVAAELELKALVIASRACIELGEYDEAEAGIARALQRAAAWRKYLAAAPPPLAAADDDDDAAAVAPAVDTAPGAGDGGDCSDRLAAIDAIVACAPLLRGSIAARSRTDRLRERQLWTGTLRSRGGECQGGGSVTAAATCRALLQTLFSSPLALVAALVLGLTIAAPLLLLR